MEKKKILSIRNMMFIALFAALLSAVAPFSVDIGPVPLTFATLVIYLAAAVLGSVKGTIAVVIYIMLGAFGLPVFSRFQGGFHVIAGTTGGFILGYIPLAFVTGIFADWFPRKIWANVLGMVIGTIILYTVGTVWFKSLTGNPLGAALAMTFYPFLPGDVAKIIVAVMTAPKLRTALNSRR
jgi:biotin transport system substrate-specific component